MQAALVRTYAAWPRVRRDDAFAYVRRTLVNYVTDRWRRKLKEYPTDELPDHPAGRDFADEVALRQWVTGALATLTARERAVIVLRYLFDLPEAAVARDLGITPGTVKSTSSRALAKLRVSAEAEAGRPRRRPRPAPRRSEGSGHDRSRHRPPATRPPRVPGARAGVRPGRDHHPGPAAALASPGGGRRRRRLPRRRRVRRGRRGRPAHRAVTGAEPSHGRPGRPGRAGPAPAPGPAPSRRPPRRRRSVAIGERLSHRHPDPRDDVKLDDAGPDLAPTPHDQATRRSDADAPRPSAEGLTPSASPSSADPATTTPGTGATSASVDQPSATPTATR